jgi:hypothetical protein
MPTPITNLLIATSGSSYQTGEITLGTPTCSARGRHGRWALYPTVITSWSSGLAAPCPDDRSSSPASWIGWGDGQDDLDHAAALAIRQFLTDPAAQDGAVWSSAPARTWSTPAAASWLSGPSDQPGYGDQTSANRPGGPAPASRTTLPQPSRRRPEPPDPTRLMELGQHRRQRHR